MSFHAHIAKGVDMPFRTHIDGRRKGRGNDGTRRIACRSVCAHIVHLHTVVWIYVTYTMCGMTPSGPPMDLMVNAWRMGMGMWI